jgi:hypothetical protein
MSDSDFRRTVMAIQSEYLEMPDLTLTTAQARRLWTLSPDVCDSALSALVAAGFLVRTERGAFARRGTPPVRIDQLDPSTWAVAPVSAGLVQHRVG